jgi:glycosyltransferase involved in cell wall biosynthesis
MVYRKLLKEDSVDMPSKHNKKPIIRQDWIRVKIRNIGSSRYYSDHSDGYFATRKGIPKGFYVLRLSINSENQSILCSVSIEPVGPNKAATKTFTVTIEHTKAAPCLRLPVRVTQRSRIKIQPTGKPGAVNAVFSILPTNATTLLYLARQWTTRKPKDSDYVDDSERDPISQEIAWRTEQMYRLPQIRHHSWPKKQSKGIEQHHPEADQKYIDFTTKIEPSLHHNPSQIKKWLDLNPDSPLISIIIPTFNTNGTHLRECIESVLRQQYTKWELCICDDCSTAEHVRTILKEYQSKDRRIKLCLREKNGHICEASNDALKMAKGEFIALLDHDDVLSNNALFYIANELQNKPYANLIYSDEDKINNNGSRSCPHFKPSFNIDLLLSYNFISHLGVYRRELIERLGGFRVGFEGSQDHDLALRTVLESTPDQIIHIPRVLYHWRAHSESTANNPNSKDYTTESGHKAIQSFLDEQHRRGGNKATAKQQAKNRFYCHWYLPQEQPMVELIIPTRDQSRILSVAIDSIVSKTIYENYKITIVDNQSIEPAAKEYFKEIIRHHKEQIQIISYNKKFNYSAINNFAVKQSKADIVVLVNNDVEVISENWLSEMVSHACRPDIGCVGAKMYYSNGLIQHGGVLIGIGQVAGHAHKYFPRESPGYVDRLQYAQQMTAVTAACLAVRREVYNEVGGLNEKDLTIAFNDVDFCLRVHARGYRNIFTPYAELYHHESISRGQEDSPEKQERFKKEINYMLNQYDIQSIKELPCDLFYNPNLTKTHENFEINTSLESVRNGINLRSSFRRQRDYYQRNSN